MVTLLWSAVLTTGGLTAFALFVAAIRRWPLLGALFIVGNILIAWELPYSPPILSISGRSIYLLDLLCSAFLIIAILDLKQLIVNVGGVALAWWAFGGLILISLLRGLASFGDASPVVEFRSFFYAFAVMVWTMSLKWDALRVRTLIAKLSMTLGWGLVIVASYHIMRYGLGGASTFVDADSGIAQTGRPLISSQSLVLLISAMVTLWRWSVERRKVLLSSGLIFVFMVILVQERTVWAAAVAVVVTLLVVGKATTRVALIASGLAGALVLGIVLTSNIAGNLVAKIADSAANFGTYGARMNSWIALVYQSLAGGPGTVVFGAPFGSGYGRMEGLGRWVEFAPHNWYLTIYLRVGLLGLALVMFFWVTLLSRTIRARTNLIAVGILVAATVYGWTYSWDLYTAFFLGWAIAGGPNPPKADYQFSFDSMSDTRGYAKRQTNSVARLQTIVQRREMG